MLFSVIDDPPSQDSSSKSHPQNTKHKAQVLENAVALQPGGSCNVVPPEEHLVVLFSEKGRCHFCRLLCPDAQVHYDLSCLPYINRGGNPVRVKLSRMCTKPTLTF